MYLEEAWAHQRQGAVTRGCVTRGRDHQQGCFPRVGSRTPARHPQELCEQASVLPPPWASEVGAGRGDETQTCCPGACQGPLSQTPQQGDNGQYLLRKGAASIPTIDSPSIPEKTAEWKELSSGPLGKTPISQLTADNHQ